MTKKKSLKERLIESGYSMKRQSLKKRWQKDGKAFDQIKQQKNKPKN